MSQAPRILAALRQAMATQSPGQAAGDRVGFGAAVLDDPLSGGLVRAGLHEIHAPGAAEIAAAAGFAVGLALRAARGRPLLWIRQDCLDAETGRPHPSGLAEFGLDPARLLLVRARDAQGVLRAGAEGARCPALGAVLIEPWGAPRVFDLTASRRLCLAAEASGVLTLLLRAAEPEASAARTRWLVRGCPSRAREANAPGDPAFSIRLLRHRGGLGEREWRVEWDRDRQSFQDRDTQRRNASDNRNRPDAAPLSRPLAAFPADRPALAGARDADWRQAG